MHETGVHASTGTASGRSFVTGLRCLRCGTHYTLNAVEYVCGCRPNTGSDMGTLDVEYDYAAIAAALTPEQVQADPDPSIGRFWPLLPIDRRSSLPPLPVGGTLLLPVARLRAEIGLRQHGALAVDGSYDDAFDLAMAACAEVRLVQPQHRLQPIHDRGKKTVSMRLRSNLTAAGVAAGGAPFAAPHAVFVSVGDGCIIGGVHKGFKDLLALGWIERMPRIYGVQSALSPALYNAWRAGDEVPQPVRATTRADSISVDAPRDPIKALNAVRQSEGAFVLVEDAAILQAMLPLARLGAVFAEPAGATAYAGLLQAWCDGLVQADETIVVINTGSGLKDVRAAMEVTGDVRIIAPNLDAVRAVLAL
ncbi:MAG: pyridoxal-phosphate dependent enzyme [Caldilineaceae bacterium]|nr:pyridoxal-phosphate dependent enzyme [Caldilineaceae bacterium]